MKSFPARLREWSEDHLLKRVVKNSAFLFGSNAINAVLSILTANLLGVAVFGVLGIVISFVSNINRLLSFRMGDVVVKYLGEFLAKEDKVGAAAVVKAAALIEGITSIVAYGLLAVLAPLGARYLSDDPALLPLFLLYGLTILANLTTETATGVLQVGGHFRSQAAINLVQSLATAGLILYAYLTGGGLMMVLVAYLAGKVILGLSPILLALYWLPRMLGRDWWKASFVHLPPLRELMRFSIFTNFSGTINMIARDSEILWVGYFFSPLVAGYYKTALALINLIVMPITPFISTTFPEITRSIVKQQWDRLTTLLKRVTIIAAGWTFAVAIGLALFGQRVLFEPWQIFGRTFSIYRSEFSPALGVLMILLVGFGAANILFWNRPLLLALGLAETSMWVGFWAMTAKVILAFIIVPHAGYLSEAALLSAYFVVSVGLMVYKGLREVSRRRAAEPQEVMEAV
ncbi:MAG: oligosaccharide flippase family protein [Anaerolineaceae bacterium]